MLGLTVKNQTLIMLDVSARRLRSETGHTIYPFQQTRSQTGHLQPRRKVHHMSLCPGQKRSSQIDRSPQNHSP